MPPVGPGAIPPHPPLATGAAQAIPPHPPPAAGAAQAIPPHPPPATIPAELDPPHPSHPLVAAAVLPHPPLLVPELAGAAAGELDPLRDACREALSAVLEAAELIVVVGGGPAWAVPRASAPGSFRPYGADVEVALPTQVDLDLPGLPPPARLEELPLSLAVAAHLLARVDPPPGRVFAATVPPSLGPGAAAAIGRGLVAAIGRGLVAAVPASPGPGAAAAIGEAPGAGDPPTRRVGLVAMGDLSACRTEQAPGAFRAEAAGFDASVAEAFRTGKPERLLDLDPTQAGELLVGGRVPLQVLAGACRAGPARHGRVLYDEAPYGVGYLVALLTAP
jgi:hypothetical protein